MLPGGSRGANFSTRTDGFGMVPRMGTKKSQAKQNFRLLGSSEAKYPERPSPDVLETFDNRFRRRSYEVRFDCAEFTSMCPVTGQPDFAVIHIRYVPDKRCIETKSLKFYLASYRHARSFNEEIVNRILEDLVAACNPRRMTVLGEFSSRGGISVTVDATYPDIFAGEDEDIPF
jgi:7-cyano-7-deazaguanine reductase